MFKHLFRVLSIKYALRFKKNYSNFKSYEIIRCNYISKNPWLSKGQKINNNYK